MVFSIVIPVYNVELYLEECINSILSQPLNLISDIILVDDGSTDSSGKICDKYAKNNRIIKVIHKRNEGPYQARIHGLKNASGDYVLFVDSDDKLLNNALQCLTELLSEFDNPDILIYDYTINEKIHYTKIDDDLVDRIIFEQDKYKLYEILCSGDEITAIWRKCIKKSVLGKAGWIEDAYINYWEDGVISCQVLNVAKNVCIVKKPLYYYRVNPKSLVHSSYTHAKYQSMRQAYIIINEYSKKWDKEFNTNMLQKMLFYDWTRRCIDIIINVLTSELEENKKEKEINILYEDNYFLQAIYADKLKTTSIWSRYIGYAAKSKNRNFAFKLYIYMFNLKKAIKTFSLKLLDKERI